MCQDPGDTESFSGDVVVLGIVGLFDQSRVQFIADDRLEHAGNLVDRCLDCVALRIQNGPGQQRQPLLMMRLA